MSDLPKTLFDLDPDSIERRLEDQNTKNGHIGTIVGYRVFGVQPPSIGVSEDGWDAAEYNMRRLFPGARITEYGAKIEYSEKQGSE